VLELKDKAERYINEVQTVIEYLSDSLEKIKAEEKLKEFKKNNN
jgi:hypothetical protein